MEKIRNVPKLRFKEFDEDWKKTKIGEIASKVNSGKTPLGGENVYTTGGVLFIRSQNVIENRLSFENSTYIPTEINNLMKNSIVKPNDILLNITGASLGRSCVVPGNFDIGNVNQHVCIIRLNGKNQPSFIQSFFTSTKGQNRFRSLQTGSGREGLNFESIKGIEINIPSLPEQQKIATFLTAVDDKIQQLTRKRALLEQYKRGVSQQIFNQEIRFKDDDGNDFPEWENQLLAKALKEHKTRNKENRISEVFSVSKAKGVINQIEHLGRSYSSNDISNYKVVFPYDIIYTKSPTSDFPFGIIKQNKLERAGVVSALYGVFTPTNKFLGVILDNYFSYWKNTYNYLNPLVRKGAKNTMNIGNDEFLNGAYFSLPQSVEEQKHISDFFIAIDNKIALVTKQLLEIQTFKKGLLQQMFV